MISKDIFYKTILPHTLKWEGGYVNDPDDKGGETYRGISRVNNPRWVGWAMLEKHKPLHKGDIVNDPQLNAAVSDLYYTKYFLSNTLDKLNSAMVALMCFDFDVNGGYDGKKLQSILNQRFSAKLLVDGVVGNKTLAVVNSLSEAQLSNAILDARLDRYQWLVKNEPKDEKFLDGWEDRVYYLRKLIAINK